jgi:hypothetical protein
LPRRNNRLQSKAVARALLFACVAVLALIPVISSADQPGGSGSPFATPTPSAVPTGSASPSNPFATPAPTPTPGRGGNGYVFFSFDALAARGGTLHIASPTPTTRPFPASGASGFSIDAAGRLSQQFLALLRFNGANVHGGDNPYVTRTEAHVLYSPPHSAFGAGAGFVSLQRSTNNTSANSFGVGVSLIPDFAQSVSPYGNLFFYPNARQLGAGGSITTMQAGIALHPHASGLIYRVGFDFHANSFDGTSPTSMGGLQLGLGTSF